MDMSVQELLERYEKGERNFARIHLDGGELTNAPASMM